jgi:hypothetical protein
MQPSYDGKKKQATCDVLQITRGVKTCEAKIKKKKTCVYVCYCGCIKVNPSSGVKSSHLTLPQKVFHQLRG